MYILKTQNMAENGYTSFGSQIVLEPKSLRISGSDINVGNFDTQCRKLKLRLKYFTIKADSDDSKKHVSNNNFQDSLNCDDLSNEGRLVVTKTNSCESFHSCYSTTSNKDLHSKGYGKRNNSNKSNDEEFIDQITMVNAIFFNKTPYGSTGDDSFINKKCYSKNTKIKEKKSSLKTGSGDRTSVQACIKCKCPPNQNNEENKETLQKGTEQQHKYIHRACELSHKNIGANNSGLKTFKISRKLIHGTKKPLMSKIIRRKEHPSLTHKYQPMKMWESTSSEINKRSDESLHSPKDDELHNCVLILYKQEIQQGEEIHYLEPIQLTNHSVGISFECSNENLINVITCDSVGSAQNLKCEIVNSCVDFQESLLQLLNNVINSESNSQLIEEITNTGINAELSEIHRNSMQNNDLKTAITNNQNSLSNIACKQEYLTVLYESEKKSDSPLNETFEHLEKNGNGFLKAESIEKTNTTDKTTINKSGESKILNKKKVKIEIEPENTSGTINRKLNSHTKRRRSSSRKSPLPVIEESPEPTQEISKTDVLENDFCLVDTLGRPIHLFDRRGMPLTDGSGRPLRSAEGELLLKCDTHGIPVVDEGTQIFDMFGRQPHVEGFQPWTSPQNFRSTRLSLEDGGPLVLFDVEGQPLTSISGTLLVDTFGRSLLKLRDLFV